jgi:AcrR family transcriptional regulator
MPDYIRARTDEQKAERLEEVKVAAERLFAEHPYHEVTLTTIAAELGWSRTNLYKYASTKEEVFLCILSDKVDSYFGALRAALPEGCGLSPETVAEVWAGIAFANRDYFRYGDSLYTVIETNVSLDRLIKFKANYFENLNTLAPALSSVLGIKESDVRDLMSTVYSHGVGLAGSCMNNPLVVRAMKELNMPTNPVDFRAEMRDFISMCIDWYMKKAR